MKNENKRERSKKKLAEITKIYEDEESHINQSKTF